MKRSYVQIEGKLYEKGSDEHMAVLAPLIMPDIQPYKSMVTGEMITSRSRHREHLRDHNMMEIGNEPIPKYKGMPDAAPQQRKELLIAQVNAMTHEQFKAAGRRDLENLRWQTRQD